ncbi:MAG: single-stranded DNA-binding protein [Clostridia bacterium]|nr:single-stranded DNA-binding protein [Clostridia bacterium]
MNYEMMNNNKVFLTGTITSEPEFSHETFGEGFYELKMSVARLSEYNDLIPITVSEKLLVKDAFKVGNKVAVKGQFRSYNKIIDGISRLVLTVFVREVSEIDDTMNPNIIEVVGYICKPPIYRTTPFKREICDLLVAVNRAYNKSDYLPCIAWGRNAKYIKDVEVGKQVSIVGRIQSREYQKKVGEELVAKIAYEISVNKIQISGQEESEAEAENDTIDSIG